MPVLTNEADLSISDIFEGLSDGDKVRSFDDVVNVLTLEWFAISPVVFQSELSFLAFLRQESSAHVSPNFFF